MKFEDFLLVLLVALCNLYDCAQSKAHHQMPTSWSSSRVYFKQPHYEFYHEQTYPEIDIGSFPAVRTTSAQSHFKTSPYFYPKPHKAPFTPANEIDYHLPAASSGQYKNYIEDLKEIYKEEREYIFKKEMERIEREYGLVLFVNDREYQKKIKMEKKEKEKEKKNQDDGAAGSRYSGGAFRYEIRI